MKKENAEMNDERNIIQAEVEKREDSVHVNGGGTVTSDNGTIETEFVGEVEE